MKMKKKKISVAVVGATGLVGRAFLRCMEKAEFVPEKLSLFASEKSDGQELEFNGEKHRVNALGKDSFAGVDLALFSAGGEVSGMYAPVAVSSGAVVIDNSSRWRMDKDVPLVVPEINLADARGKKLVANPNCSTIQAALPLWALRDTIPQSVAFTTFQAVSGAGKRGLDALENARTGMADDFFGTDISSTCLPQIGTFLSDGSTEEEVKMINETKKILHRPDLKISATCVRVPVPNGHGVSIVMRAGRDFKTEEVISALKAQEGIVLKDVPLCRDVYGTDWVAVGRVRKSAADERELLFYCVADNLLRGAAANAVKIAEGIFS